MNQINNQKLLDPFSDKKEIQVNVKNKTRITKKKNTVKRPQINNNIKNNIDQPQAIQRLPKRGMTNPAIIGKKPEYFVKNQVFNNDKKIDFSWLNKYFIYRHESLNKYLFKEEFKQTFNNLPNNYHKLVYNFHRLKPISNSLNGAKSPNNNNNYTGIENKNIISNLNSDKTNRIKKFIVTGGYCDVVKNLKERGWAKEPNSKSIEFDYIWTLKTNEINFMILKNYQLCNHYFKNGQITRKSGLCKNIKNLYYLGIDPMNFFPRCYDLSIKSELEDFKQDFKFTWAMSLLKLLQIENNEFSRINRFSKKFSTKVISTAIDIVERNLNIIDQKIDFFQKINDLKNKNFLVSDEEWNIIYLPELTTTSNVQDIIYEVNSNKPGGINNPIKIGNKTVPKKIINKPNDTKRMLVNMQKVQIGSNDTNKFSPNLKSITGLKSKISQMNNEEKKNNLNEKSLAPKNSIKQSIKENIPVKDGAEFEKFIPKIEKILIFLEQNLPQYKLNGFRNIWIMKPSNLSRGRGVTCVDSLLPIEQSLSATNDSGLIVQKYIENPLIINQRKFDIRQWVLVTCLNPLTIWMWKEPYLRFGAEDYKMDDLNNIYSHLTNNSIAKHSLQYKQEKKFEEDMWTCFDFQKFLGPNKWKEIHEKIKNAIICSFFAVHQEIKQRENSHELYGYDFMIDENFNVYLIEVNASPALDYSTKITEKAVKDMVKDLIKIVIDNNNGKDFKVNDNGEGNSNKFIQIFNESKDNIKIPKNVPNKTLFY